MSGRAGGAARGWWPVRMAVIGILIFDVVWLALPDISSAPSTQVPPGLELRTSGLAAYDPLTGARNIRSVQDHYVFAGSAPRTTGYEAESSEGLVVGVRRHPGWMGWFGVTLDGLPTDASYHVRMWRPPGAVRAGPGEAVFAVQTALTQRNGAINYVVVAAVSWGGQTRWVIGYAHGLIADASTRIFWRSPATADSPETEDITLRTDGQRCLTVWFGAARVFSSCHLHLDIPGPYQAYLEVQARDIGYYARFQDFWVARAGPIRLTGTAPRSTVSLIAPGDKLLARARAAGSGAVTLSVPPPMSSGIASLHVGGEQRGPWRYSTGDELVWANGRGG